MSIAGSIFEELHKIFGPQILSSITKIYPKSSKFQNSYLLNPHSTAFSYFCPQSRHQLWTLSGKFRFFSLLICTCCHQFLEACIAEPQYAVHISYDIYHITYIVCDVCIMHNSWIGDLSCLSMSVRVVIWERVSSSECIALGLQWAACNESRSIGHSNYICVAWKANWVKFLAQTKL